MAGQLRHQDRSSWPEVARAVCARASCVGVIDTTPAFEACAAEHRGHYYDFYVGGDVHFNPDGNRLIFDALSTAASKE